MPWFERGSCMVRAWFVRGSSHGIWHLENLRSVVSVLGCVFISAKSVITQNNFAIVLVRTTFVRRSCHVRAWFEHGSSRGIDQHVHLTIA